MLVDIKSVEAIVEIEELKSRFGLSAEQVIERIILDAGHWMPMETLADSHWLGRNNLNEADAFPWWHRLVTKLPTYAKNWTLEILNEPPHFVLTHLCGFKVTLSVYDPKSPLWVKAPGLLLEFIGLQCKPRTYRPEGFSKTPSQRSALVKQARRIVAEIDPLAVMTGKEKACICRYIEANPFVSYDYDED